MKSFIRIVTMMTIGLLVAIVIYPFLHETGHSITTIIVGGEVIEYHLFPLPSILCNVAKVSSMGKVLIGISGMLFPITITTLFFHPQKRFYLWYTNLILRGICALSIVITIVATILYAVGKPVANEDITTVLNITPNLIEITSIASLLVLSGLTIIIVKDKPLIRIGNHLKE